MRIVVDLNRCLGYAQCVPLAPDVLKLVGEEALAYDPNPDDSQRQRVLRAAASCPVQAILVETYHPGWRGIGMTAHPLLADLVPIFKAEGRIVIVGASLAGLRAAEALRDEGFRGSLTLIGDEPHEPYDRPPLSKQVRRVGCPPSHQAAADAGDSTRDWRLGVAATGLDRAQRRCGWPTATPCRTTGC